ncbi:MAG: ATP-binding response regulator [Anaerolineae bacterium]
MSTSISGTRSLDLDDLRGSTLPAAAPLMLAVSLVLVWRYLPGDEFRWQECLVGATAALCAALAWVLCRTNTLVAAVVLVVGHSCTALLGAMALPAGVGAILFSLPIASSVILATPRATAVAAAAAIGSQVALHLLWRSQPYLELAIFADAAMATALVVAGSSHTRVLRWSWERHSNALRLAEDLRDRQGQLNRTIKALDLAYRLLQRTNHELALARQEAEDARQLKERFATNISHELRTPLNLILGFTEMMYASPDVYGNVNWTATLRRDVAQVFSASRHLLQLIDDVLDLSRLDGERIPLRKGPCALNDIIEEAVGAVRDLLRAGAPQGRRRRLRLRVELDAAIPRLWLDSGRMRQVLLNLLNNAVRFTEAGEIVVRSQRAGQEVHISVSDTGVGISDAELPAVFDEFYQAEAAANHPGGGMGLGLAIAKRFVHMHGGRIWAESPAQDMDRERGRGPGCTFHVAIPLESKRPAASRLRTSRRAALPGNPYPETVLLLGGQGQPVADIAHLLERHLGDCRILTPGTADEAQHLVQEQHPRAVIRNFSLAELRRLMGQMLPAGLPQTVPVLYSAIPCAAWRAEMLGVYASLRKPLGREELLLLLRALPNPPAADRVGVVGPRDVMVVDDDPGFTEVVTRMLQATSPLYRVRSAYSGAEGLAEMSREPPEVLLLDLRLPDLDGTAVLAHMRADPGLEGVPVIVVTAMDVEEEPGWLDSGFAAISQRAGLGLADSLKAIAGLLAVAHPRYDEPATAEEIEAPTEAL